MKRSNRLVLLVGVFLAVIAFVGVLLLSGDPGPGIADPDAPKTELPTVIATRDIPLGTAIRADQVRVEVKPIEGRDNDAFGDVSQVIGQIARQEVVAGAAVTGRTLALTGGGSIVDIKVPAGQRAMSVRVDQVTGVGTVIKSGDYVDLVVSITDPNFPLVVIGDEDGEAPINVVGFGPLGAELYNPTSAKLLLQGVQVLGTLLPPVPQADPNAPPVEGQSGTALTDREAIVILSVTPQQAEVIKWAQVDGSISLALRSPDDFVDESGEPIVPESDVTTGIMLKNLVDVYGVLPPEVVPAIQPSPVPAP